MNMTQSLEDYLEMVSFLADEGEVRVTDIAARLGVSKPSVLTAIKTLEDEGLLEHVRYGGISLTKKGSSRALEIRERHELLTLFLQKILGVDAKIAEEDACKMEHLLSEETLKKIKTLMGSKKAPPAMAKSKKASPAKPAPGKKAAAPVRGKSQTKN